MKSPLRNITVDNHVFVYWHSGGPRFVLHISPKVDKNIKITLVFAADPPDEDPFTSWCFYDITAQKNNEQTIIHLGKPRHIAEIIDYLKKERPELWCKGQPHIIENAWDTLRDMGYTNLRPIWKGEF
ncbi:hypothetical protein [Paenibacillus massiliensis]|uniref:hypothetical protein n=1 Tax=Paenibacillus massiliensis TaxID=225917 RepID=UPI000470CA60|nr:hypothetical protein [Paenibacillus massiliensis]